MVSLKRRESQTNVLTMFSVTKPVCEFFPKKDVQLVKDKVTKQVNLLIFQT